MSSIEDKVKASVAAATTAVTDFFAPATPNTPLKMKSPDVTAYQALPSAQSDSKKPVEAMPLSTKKDYQDPNTFRNYNTFRK